MTWTPPEDDGGSAITNYILEYRVEGAFAWTKATDKTITETKFTAKKLEKGAMYEFHVAAENVAGIGPFSENTSPVKATELLGQLNIAHIITFIDCSWLLKLIDIF